ncbi:hypothetical protein GCM10010919_00770 [Alishewanella longhuensis]|uniref:histidine kinase n=2 Tax=Alishewanella longhuensis TaxID=1091037 RepID=A0ABQ3KSX5_9ALTE|nr:hypothetical protein GCM10010919_00770 [Alishewanella longhuensis]
MAQDQQGFLWLGTQHGLFRHDGTEILEFKADPSIPGNLSASWVSALAVDPAGWLWVGTRYGGLNRFDPATERFVRYDLPASSGLQSAEIASLKFDANGILWVATYGAGLFRLINDVLVAESLPDNLGKTAVNFINELYFDGQGGSWLALGDAPIRTMGQQAGGVLYRAAPYRDWQLLPFVTKDGDAVSVTRIRKTAAGKILATTYGHGLFVFDDSKQHFIAALQPKALTKALLTDIWLDTDQNLWLSSYNTDFSGGLWYHGANGEWRHYPFASEFTEGLARADLMGLFADHQGILWTISQAGVRGLSRFAKAIKTVPPGLSKAGLLPAPNVLGIDAISHSEVWLANREAGVVLFNPQDSTVRHWPFPATLPQLKSAQAIKQDAQQQLWVGTNEGLYLLDSAEDRWQLFPLSLQVEPFINGIYLDRQQNLWIGTRGQGLFQVNAARSRVIHYHDTKNDAPYLRFGDVNNIFEDQHGAIWIGSTDQGVARFDPQTKQFNYWLQHAGSEHGLQMNGIQLITEDASKQLWLRAGNVNHRVVFDGKLPEATRVFQPYLQLKEADEFLQQAEVFRLLYRLHWLPEQNTYLELNEAHGMQSVTWIGAWDVHNKVIYRGGAKGFDYFDISELPRKVALNPVQLTSFSLFNQPVRPGSAELPQALAYKAKLQLSYHQDMFSLRFASPDFKQSQLIQYRYRLNGFDRDWIQSTAKSPVATYTRLPPATYLFEVSASLPGGEWLPSTSLVIEVLPPWWLTWWFRLTMLVSIILLLTLIVRWKLQQEYQVRHRLEQLVAQRTNELAEQNQALELSYRQLQQTQQQLITQEKMASLGGLVAGVAHEINTPLGICVTASSHLQAEQQKVAEAFSNRTLQQRQFERFLQHLTDGLKILQVNTLRAAELVNSFKQVSVDQSRDTYREFNLANYLNDVILSLSARLKKQNCQLQLECPGELTMFSDPGALAQIITNLVINALLHGLEHHSAPVIRLVVTEEPELVQILFVDNGIGMPEENLRQLFDPFFTTKRNQGGSGLGAHIVFNLVTVRLQGDIKVSSEPGQGLQYLMRLPRFLKKA